MNWRWENIVYVLLDFAAAIFSWYLFVNYLEDRQYFIGLDDHVCERIWTQGAILIPFGWSFVYLLFEHYKDVYRLSRWSVFTGTFILSVAGSIGILFILLRDQHLNFDNRYFITILMYFLYYFGLISTVRLLFLTYVSYRLKKGVVGFNTLIIGGDQRALELYNDINSSKYSQGNLFIGFIHSNGGKTNDLIQFMPQLGGLSDINKVIDENKIQEVLIAIESTEHTKLKSILDSLFEYGSSLLVRIIPDMYDILLGTVKMNHVYGTVLIEIKQEMMPRWQIFVKRIFDIVVSFCMLVLLSPIIFYITLRTWLSGPGGIFYSQERIGLNGKPFYIYKFRSMITEAEKNGPQLSNSEDDRVTSWGAIMRKWRLDELPQFWNVIKGDMSLVGPRPERKYFIDLIMSKAPHYKHLLKVRPGITSWGQVKFGYASNLDEMLQRLKFDILYVENRSLGLDVKILFYTVSVLFQGKGK
ncbi:MAG: sugar transferase [Bacteroidota bacterium]|nr:sugar transferase [Bacteroidota bacterium]